VDGPAGRRAKSQRQITGRQGGTDGPLRSLRRESAALGGGDEQGALLLLRRTPPGGHAIGSSVGGAVYPESFWRSLKHLNDFRLFLSGFFFLLGVFQGRISLIDPQPLNWYLAFSLLYGLTAIVFVQLRRTGLGFERQLWLQLLTDIGFVVLLMHWGGGNETGLGLVLLVPMAGAGMFPATRNMLTVTAVATIAVLLEQTLQDWGHASLLSGYTRAALLSIGLFTVAGLSHFLAKGTLAAIGVAGKAVQDLANLERINARVIGDLPYGVLVIDGQGKLLQANQQARRFLGEDLPEIGVEVGDLPMLGDEWREWQAHPGERVCLLQSRHDHHRLRARWSDLGAEGYSGAVIIIEDLTELELQASNMKLAALGRLTANLAHEIRNPLSSINHASQLLSEDADPGSPQARLTRIIEENASRLNWLVEDVLTLNRRDRVSSEPLDTMSFLGEFVTQYIQTERLPHGLFNLQVGGVVPDICFDRLHLNQILWNLCRNANRYCSGSPGSMALHASARGDRVEIDVYNDGPPLSPDMQMRLFEPFFTTNRSGTGLGLFIARELAEANQATLRSLPQTEGAVFRLSCRMAPR